MSLRLLHVPWLINEDHGLSVMKVPSKRSEFLTVTEGIFRAHEIYVLIVDRWKYKLFWNELVYDSN